jgi:hypothetical protein
VEAAAAAGAINLHSHSCAHVGSGERGHNIRRPGFPKQLGAGRWRVVWAMGYGLWDKRSSVKPTQKKKRASQNRTGVVAFALYGSRGIIPYLSLSSCFLLCLIASHSWVDDSVCLRTRPSLIGVGLMQGLDQPSTSKHRITWTTTSHREESQLFFKVGKAAYLLDSGWYRRISKTCCENQPRYK